MNCARAIASGLRFRPIAETVRDTLAWHATRGEVDRKAGLSKARETELLAKWAAEQIDR
jgi:2'-hydroxyisoflavone reductase